MLRNNINESPSNINTTDNKVAQTEFTLEQIEEYVRNYYKEMEYVPEDFENELMNFLKTKGLINLCKTPTLIEMVCLATQRDKYSFVYLENNFYDFLLQSQFLRYLNTMKERKGIPDKTNPNHISTKYYVIQSVNIKMIQI